MQGKITITDIAKAAGVSKTTVSRFLNGHYEFMSAETREKIANIIAATNYNPNRMARSLKSKRSNLIAIVTHSLPSRVAPHYVKGIHDICAEHGYSTIIASNDNLLEREYQSLKMCLGMNVDGLVLLPINTETSFYTQIHESGTPVVLCVRHREDWPYGGVYIDNEALCIKAWEHLLANGYERIAFFCEKISPENAVAQWRDAFLEFAQTRLGLSLADCVYEVKDDEALTKRCFAEFMGRFPNHRKAVFTISTNTMFNVLKAIRDENLSTPEDLGICGYDLLGWSDLIQPGITVLRQPLYELGVEAGRLLLEQINDPKQKSKQIWLQGSLTVNHSTSAL